MILFEFAQFYGCKITLWRFHGFCRCIKVLIQTCYKSIKIDFYGTIISNNE